MNTNRRFVVRLSQNLLIIAWLLTATNAFSQTARVKHNSNLRKSATISSTIIVEVSAGTDVTLLSNKKRNGYYHAKLDDGRAGWLIARNIATEPPVAATPSPSPSSAGAGQAFDPGCALPFESIKQKHPVIDDSCSIDGEKTPGVAPTGYKLAENHAKNNFCLTTATIDISYQDLLQLEQRSKNLRGPNLPRDNARKDKLGSLLSVSGQQIGEGAVVRL